MVAKSARTYQKNEKVVIKKRPFIIQGTCYGAFAKGPTFVGVLFGKINTVYDLDEVLSNV